MNYYNIKHANTSIPDYTVYDNTTNTDTSLKFPGRFVAGYGQAIAENFLHLLENFASASEPSSPQIGQLWYDTASGYLRVHSGTGSSVAARWKAASGIEYNDVNPGTAVTGQLWVDTANRQLNIYTGSSWMVIGPTISTRDGLKNGPLVEEILDDSNTTRSILSVYIADIRVLIVSKDTFQPKLGIPGYGKINSGVNLNNPVTILDKANFHGGLPVFSGTATAATQLIVGKETVESSKFLRTDKINNTEYAINIKHNDGLAIGTDRNLIVTYSASTKAAALYNSSEGSIELQTKIDHAPKTVLKVTGTTVGINTEHPAAELDVTGNAKVSGKLTIAGINGDGLDITGKVTKGLIVDQTQKDSVLPTDTILMYRDGDYLSKTTVANLLASVQPQQQVSNALPARKTLQQTTTNLAAGASIKLTLPGGYKGYALYSINVSSSAWVRVYTTSTDATSFAEVNRVEGTPAAANSGVVAEISTTTDNETIKFTPALIGYNSETNPNNDVVIRLKNKGASAVDITVKLTILQLEA
jgi:hypothetical protein